MIQRYNKGLDIWTGRPPLQQGLWRNLWSKLKVWWNKLNGSVIENIYIFWYLYWNIWHCIYCIHRYKLRLALSSPTTSLTSASCQLQSLNVLAGLQVFRIILIILELYCNMRKQLSLRSYILNPKSHGPSCSLLGWGRWMWPLFI